MSMVKGQLRPMARFAILYQERGFSREMARKIGGHSLPLLVLNDEVFEASSQVEHRKPIPCILEGKRQRLFRDPEEFSSFLSERIESNIALSKTETNYAPIAGREARKLGKALESSAITKKVRQPNVTRSVRRLFAQAEQAMGRKGKTRLTEAKRKKLAILSRTLAKLKGDLSEFEVSLKTANDGLADIERKRKRTEITWDVYITERTRFSNRKYAIEGQISRIHEKTREQVLVKLREI
jgi:hypothetical protein